MKDIAISFGLGGMELGPHWEGLVLDLERFLLWMDKLAGWKPLPYSLLLTAACQGSKKVIVKQGHPVPWLYFAPPLWPLFFLSSIKLPTPRDNRCYPFFKERRNFKMRNRSFAICLVNERNHKSLGNGGLQTARRRTDSLARVGPIPRR